MADTVTGTGRRFAVGPYLALLPFFAFLLFFLIVPTFTVVFGAFQSGDGGFTLGNLRALGTDAALNALWKSVLLSFTTALLGALLGALLSYLILSLGEQSIVRRATISVCGVLAQFGGVTLAFAFISLLAINGVLTLALDSWIGLDIYGSGWLFGLKGLIVVYVYFQIPLMVIVFTPGPRGPPAAVARGRGQPRRDHAAVLAAGRHPAADAGLPRLGPAALRQRVRGVRHRGRAGQPGQPDHAAVHPLGADQRDPAGPGQRRLRAGAGDDRRRLHRDGPVRPAAAPDLAVDAMNVSTGFRVFRGIAFALFALYFALPLLSMLDFSTRAKGDATGRTSDAWVALVENDDLREAIVSSLLLAVFTVVLMVALLVPTMIWVRLRVPGMSRTVEFLCLLPLTIPALVIVVGIANVYAWVTYLFGDSALTLTFVYVVLVLPYAYRAIDSSLAAIDVVTLAEAARSLGAGWMTVIVRIVFPNIIPGVLGAAFISVALVLGEFTVASLLHFDTMPVALTAISKSDAATAIAGALASIIVISVLLLVLSLLSRDRRTKGIAS